MEKGLKDIEDQIELLQKKKKELLKPANKKLLESLKLYECFFTVMVMNAKNTTYNHYGCFSTFNKAQEAVGILNTMAEEEGDDSIVIVGVKAFCDFNVTQLRDLDDPDLIIKSGFGWLKFKNGRES